MSNPFDFSQFFPKCEPQDMLKLMQTQFQSQMQSAFGAFAAPKYPEFDMSSLNEAQQKNMQALATSNMKAIEGTQKLMQKQAELFQEAFSDASKAGESIAKAANNPAEAVQKQSDLIQAAFEKALHASSDISELITKAQEDMTDIVSKRVNEGLEEIKQTFKG